MFAKATVAVLAGAVAVSALDSRTIHSILSRQLSPSSVPEACQSTCSSTFTIYDACMNGDVNTCLTACSPSTYSELVGCFQCVLDQTPGVSQSEVDQVNDVVAQLEGVCAQAGQTVSAASLTAGSGAATASGVSGSDTGAIASITEASFTSASGGLTLSGSGGGAAAATSSVARTSASGGGAAAASSAGGSSAAPSTSTSGAAGVAAKLPNFAGIALGLVGVGAGAAFIL